MTSPIQINRWDRLVRRLSGIVGEGSIVTGTLPDVFPVLELENLETDSWLDAGWKLCFGFEEIIDALLNVEIALENLVGSNMLVIVESIEISVSGDTPIEYGTNAAGTVLAGSSNDFSTMRDSRATGTRRPVTQVSEGTAIPFSPFGRFRMLGGTREILAPPKGFGVLAPGNMFVVRCSTANITTAVTYFWRERLIEPSEDNL